MSNNLLIVCRRFNADFPRQIGGVIASSENLIKFVEDNSINYQLVDTNKTQYGRNLIAFIVINYLIISKLRQTKHVALNLNEKELYLIAPFVMLFCKALNVQYSVRVFGGNFDNV